MSIELSDELRRQLKQAAPEPVRLVDPLSQEEFVVVRADTYARLRQLAESECIDPSLYEFED